MLKEYKVTIEFSGIPNEVYKVPLEDGYIPNIKNIHRNICKDLMTNGYYKTTNPRIIGGRRVSHIFIPPHKIKRVTLTMDG